MGSPSGMIQLFSVLSTHLWLKVNQLYKLLHIKFVTNIYALPIGMLGPPMV